MFVLFRKLTLDRVVPHLEKYQGTVLHTSLKTQKDQALRHALAHTWPRPPDPDAGIGLFERRAGVDAAG